MCSAVAHWHCGGDSPLESLGPGPDPPPPPPLPLEHQASLVKERQKRRGRADSRAREEGRDIAGVACAPPRAYCSDSFAVRIPLPSPMPVPLPPFPPLDLHPHPPSPSGGGSALLLPPLLLLPRESCSGPMVPSRWLLDCSLPFLIQKRQEPDWLCTERTRRPSRLVELVS
jgi:hypothetical protein